MKKHEHIVKSLMPGGIGEELGIEPGDKLLAINGNEIQDVFDYYYYEESEQLLLLIEKPDGEEWELEIEKDEDESLGIEFDQSLMDEYRSCRNKCMFCFIDQMPKGMRETLYFKDDDSRLSFLQGNYITLTNMSDHDVERIVKYRLEPINISFQTTNPELRCKMLHNRFAGEALKKVDILYRGQIEMNGQIVLCDPGSDRISAVFKECFDRSGRTDKIPGRTVSSGAVYKRRCQGGAFCHPPLAGEDLSGAWDPHDPCGRRVVCAGRGGGAGGRTI